ncbi:tail length tape measure protein [Clostridium sp. ZS1]|uniref:tail length tape measure protein n=1 Tax=Clostridium sp. ZS1 TaxID=2949989 RepID=UPI00207A360D|nr:tail length tape measure protein [Clostridium sp. ZS1]
MASMETGLMVMDGMVNQPMRQPVIQMQQIQLIQQQISLTNVLQINVQKAADEQDKLNQNVNKSTSSMSALATKASETFKSFFNAETLKNGISAVIGEASKMQDKMLSVQGMLGDKGAGTAYFNHLQKQANESGFSFDELKNNAQSFMGVTKNTESLDKLANLSERLSLGNSGEGISGAGGAINSMISGDGSDLKNKFGFSSEDIGILQASNDLDDFSSKFDQLLNSKGLDASMLDGFNNSASAQFENLKENFNSSLGEAGQGALEAFTPVMQMLNEMFSNGSFQSIIEIISLALQGIGEIIAWVCEGVINNWDVIEPILMGLAAGVLILGAIMLGYSIIQGISNVLTTEKATADSVATASQWGLNLALLSCPLTWIVIAIIAVMVALIAWACQTNGLKATWLICTNTLISAWDSLRLNAILCSNGVMNGFDSMCIAALKASIGIKNFLGNLRADGLIILQDFVNKSIDMVNDLINKVNKIPGVSIETISHVTFGTDAQIKNLAEQQERQNQLNDRIAKAESDKQSRYDYYNNELEKSNAARLVREANISEAKDQYLLGNNDSSWKNMFNNNSLLNQDNDTLGNNSSGIPSDMGGGSDALTSAIDNTNLGNNVSEGSEAIKGINDSVEVSNENLELMNDLAELESLQNFITLTPTVQVTTGDIKEEADINTIISRIESYMENEMTNSAEGLYA